MWHERILPIDKKERRKKKHRILMDRDGNGKIVEFQNSNNKDRQIDSGAIETEKDVCGVCVHRLRARHIQSRV